MADWCDVVSALEGCLILGEQLFRRQSPLEQWMEGHKPLTALGQDPRICMVGRALGVSAKPTPLQFEQKHGPVMKDGSRT